MNVEVESVEYAYFMQTNDGKKSVNVYKVILSSARAIYVQATDELDAWKQGKKFASKLT